jgi:hypothetical protein
VRGGHRELPVWYLNTTMPTPYRGKTALRHQCGKQVDTVGELTELAGDGHPKGDRLAFGALPRGPKPAPDPPDAGGDDTRRRLPPPPAPTSPTVSRCLPIPPLRGLQRVPAPGPGPAAHHDQHGSAENTRQPGHLRCRLRSGKRTSGTADPTFLPTYRAETGRMLAGSRT